MTARHTVVVGAGPGGLSAAAAALAAGARVTLIDAAEEPGGQYNRPLPDAYAAARPDRIQHDWHHFDGLRRRVLGHPLCTWWARTQVWALEPPADGAARPPAVHVMHGIADGSGRARSSVTPDALVLATGAHDRVLPFPGWELPGVFTAGAAQALVKGERVVLGDQVVVAGTGPFLLPVAGSLLEAGSSVTEVLEASTPAAAARGWLRRPWELAAQAGKAGELLGYGQVLARRRVPYRFARAVVEVRGDGRAEEAVTARVRPDWSVVPGTERVLAVDAVCVTHGFSPRLELPLAAGCALGPGPSPAPRGASRVQEDPSSAQAGEFVAVDGDQRTSARGVYAVGEITGVAGAPAARAEGAVAGWLAGGGDPDHAALGALRRKRDQGRAFARRLARAHPVGGAWPGWLREDTVICRCEGARYASVCRAAEDAAGADARAAKLGTRAGLGPCQARVCGPTVAELRRRVRGDGPAPSVPGLPAAGPHHRPIAQPVRLGELAAAPVDDAASPLDDPASP